jgi:AraC family transcriptional activator of tynA and feaB
MVESVSHFVGPTGLRAFGASLVDTLVEQTVATDDPEGFSASVASILVGDVGVVETTISRVRSRRRVAPRGEGGSIFLLLCRSGHGQISHRRGLEVISSDRAIVVPATESFDVSYPGRARLTFVVIPGPVARRFELDGPIRSLPLSPSARSVSRALSESAAAARRAESSRPLAALADVVRATLDILVFDGLDASEPAVRVAAERIIHLHLGDGALDAPQVARRLGISVRSLHRAFEAGLSVSQFIRRERLRRAAADLVLRPTASIADIAYENGFGSPSQFAGHFRREFGLAPYEWRRWRGSDVDLSPIVSSEDLRSS